MMAAYGAKLLRRMMERDVEVHGTRIASEEADSSGGRPDAKSPRCQRVWVFGQGECYIYGCADEWLICVNTRCLLKDPKLDLQRCNLGRR
jgi:hypothetical protein